MGRLTGRGFAASPACEAHPDDIFARPGPRIASLADLGRSASTCCVRRGACHPRGLGIAHERGLAGLRSVSCCSLGEPFSCASCGYIGPPFLAQHPRWRAPGSDHFRVRGRTVAKGARPDRPSRSHLVLGRPQFGPHPRLPRKSPRRRVSSTSVVKSTTASLGFTVRAMASAAMATATGSFRGRGRSGANFDDTIKSAATALLDQCKAKALTVATAESCTGGLVAAALTEISGSSAVVDRGFVTYTNRSKHDMLGVPLATLERHGAVSRETAEAMAQGALAHAPADLGLRSPGSRSNRRHAEKPVCLGISPRRARGRSFMPSAGCGDIVGRNSSWCLCRRWRFCASLPKG